MIKPGVSGVGDERKDHTKKEGTDYRVEGYEAGIAGNNGCPYDENTWMATLWIAGHGIATELKSI